MSTIKNFIKKIVLDTLPETVSSRIRKTYYLNVIRNYRIHNEPDLLCLKYLIKEGDTVVDIGANIGIYTMFLSGYVGSSGKVFSIEPVPQTFDILNFNIKKLGLDNVKTINCAISDTDCDVTMEVPSDETGIKNYFRARIAHKNTGHFLRQVTVKAKSTDTLFSELELSKPISFIKCDVEGHELQCVQGTINIIKKRKPAWLIEISGDPDNLPSTAYKTFELLLKNGYKSYWFDGSKLKRRFLGNISINYFFLTEEHLQRIRQQNFSILHNYCN